MTTEWELDDLRETADHEANHLVLSELLNPYRARGATIRPGDGTLGAAFLPYPIDDPWTTPQMLLIDAVCSVGGDLEQVDAAMTGAPLMLWEGVQGDMHMARAALERAFGANKLDDALDSAVVLAGRFLWWRPVYDMQEVISSALLEREQLVGNEVDAVIGAARPGRFYALHSRAARLIESECERLQNGAAKP